MRKTFASLALLCVFGVSPVSAQDFASSPSMGSTVLDLDTADGHVSGWQIGDLSGVNALRTTLHIERLGGSRDWLPSFTIALVNDNGHVSFQIVNPAHSQRLVLHLIRYAGKMVADDQTFSSSTALHADLDVAIDWTVAGSVTVRLGPGEAHTESLDGAPTNLQILCSTGEVRFDPLKIGRATP